MGKPKPVQHVWEMHRSLMGTEWNSQWSWCGWDWRHGWKRAHCLPDPAPAKQWTYEAWPQGWILALYGDVVWWYDLDTPMYRLQRAHAHLVFKYQACLHEWSIWIASVFAQGKYRRRRCGTLLVQTVREWHRSLAIEGLIHSVTQEEHDDIRQFWRSQKAILEPIQMGCYSDGSAKYVTNFLIRGC